MLVPSGWIVYQHNPQLDTYLPQQVFPSIHKYTYNVFIDMPQVTPCETILQGSGVSQKKPCTLFWSN